MKRMMAKVAENITSTVKLNDGVSMPLFGLGVWRYSICIVRLFQSI